MLRGAVYGFLNCRLLGADSDEPLGESIIGRPPLRDRMVWWGRRPPAAISARALKDLWRRRGEAALRPHLRDPAKVRKALGPLLPHALGVAPDSVGAYREPRTVAVTAEGGALVVRPVPGREPDTDAVGFYDTYNHGLLATRVHEVLAALEAAGGRMTLIGKGRAGPACLLAGALAGRATALDVDLRGFDPDKDSSWRKHFDAPCIRQVGGLATVFARLAGRAIKLRNALPQVQRLAARYMR